MFLWLLPDLFNVDGGGCCRYVVVVDADAVGVGASGIRRAVIVRVQSLAVVVTAIFGTFTSFDARYSVPHCDACDTYRYVVVTETRVKSHFDCCTSPLRYIVQHRSAFDLLLWKVLWSVLKRECCFVIVILGYLWWYRPVVPRWHSIWYHWKSFMLYYLLLPSVIVVGRADDLRPAILLLMALMTPSWKSLNYVWYAIIDHCDHPSWHVTTFFWYYLNPATRRRYIAGADDVGGNDIGIVRCSAWRRRAIVDNAALHCVFWRAIQATRWKPCWRVRGTLERLIDGRRASVCWWYVWWKFDIELLSCWYVIVINLIAVYSCDDLYIIDVIRYCSIVRDDRIIGSVLLWKRIYHLWRCLIDIVNCISVGIRVHSTLFWWYFWHLAISTLLYLVCYHGNFIHCYDSGIRYIIWSLHSCCDCVPFIVPHSFACCWCSVSYLLLLLIRIRDYHAVASRWRRHRGGATSTYAAVPPRQRPLATRTARRASAAYVLVACQ